METERIEAPRALPALGGAGLSLGSGTIGAVLFVAAYLTATAFVARSDIGVQSLVLVAAVFGILAISLDLVAGMLGLYSLGQGGFFAIGAYFTTIVVNNLGWNVFLVLLIVLLVAGLIGLAVGAMSLRVSGLYFAITTFIFTLVLTVLATDLKITGGLQGLLGPAFPDFPEGLEALGTPVAWCVMLALLLCIGFVWSIRQSPLYPVLLSIRDAERFAEAAGARTSLIKIGVFGVSAAMAGGAGWLFAFLGVVSPGQFDWAVSLNILVMVLIGGINTTLGPVIGAAFVSMFPALVNINPWLQEMVYGALSILAVTLLPGGVMSLLKRVAAFGGGAAPATEPAVSAFDGAEAPVEASLFRKFASGSAGDGRRRAFRAGICGRMPRHPVQLWNRPHGAAQRRPRGQARRYSRAHRAERIGQKHARQCDRWAPAAARRRRRSSRGCASTAPRRASAPSLACAGRFRRPNSCVN